MVKNNGIWDLQTAKNNHCFSPNLAKVLMDILPKDKPVYDFGCGKGSYLQALSENNYSCKGFEGTKGITKISDFGNIVDGFDLSKSHVSELEQLQKGSVLSFEVAEHIPEYYQDIFVENITTANQSGDYLIISWAIRGQGGIGHVNEKDESEVLQIFEKLGYKHYEILSAMLRIHAKKDYYWFANTIYCFKKL